LPVSGRRLVYKFGPNAAGWRASAISIPFAHATSGLYLPAHQFQEENAVSMSLADLSGTKSSNFEDQTTIYFPAPSQHETEMPLLESGETGSEEDEEEDEDLVPVEIQCQLSIEDPGSILL